MRGGLLISFRSFTSNVTHRLLLLPLSLGSLWKALPFSGWSQTRHQGPRGGSHPVLRWVEDSCLTFQFKQVTATDRTSSVLGRGF